MSKKSSRRRLNQSQKSDAQNIAGATVRIGPSSSWRVTWLPSLLTLLPRLDSTIIMHRLNNYVTITKEMVAHLIRIHQLLSYFLDLSCVSTFGMLPSSPFSSCCTVIPTECILPQCAKVGNLYEYPLHTLLSEDTILSKLGVYPKEVQDMSHLDGCYPVPRNYRGYL